MKIAALGFLTPQQAPATGCGGRSGPQICTKGAAWPLPQPHPCTPTLWGLQGPWVSPTWSSPKPSPRVLVGLDGTTQAGQILALLGHPDLSIALKSGSLCMMYPHPPLASQEKMMNPLWRRGYRAGCRTPGWEGLQPQKNKVPRTFPAGTMALINQMSMAGMGRTSLGMESRAQWPSLRALRGSIPPRSGLDYQGGDPDSAVGLVRPTPPSLGLSQ